MNPVIEMLAKANNCKCVKCGYRIGAHYKKGTVCPVKNKDGKLVYPIKERE